MGAVVAEVPDRRKRAVSHGPCLFFAKVLGRRLPVILKVAHGGSMAVFGVSLKSHSKLSRKIGNLARKRITPGLEVVTWQKVDPVGGI